MDESKNTANEENFSPICYYKHQSEFLLYEEREYTHSTICDKLRTIENHHRTGNGELFYLIYYLLI